MEFYQTQIGNTLPVLWEHENRDGMMYGFTENYVRVEKPFDANFCNEIQHVELKEIGPAGNVIVQSSFENFLINA